MAHTTPNYKMQVPDPQDWADVTVLGGNFETMDRELGAQAKAQQSHAQSRDNPHHVTAEQAGADPAGTAARQVSAHNVDQLAHNDLRLLVAAIDRRLDALLDTDESSLDQLSEIVAYIQHNRSVLEGVTTSKVNVTDIVNNLVTNLSNRPLSAAQGVALKKLIDAIKVPTKLASPYALTVSRGDDVRKYDGSGPETVDLPELRWHLLQDWTASTDMPGVGMTLGKGYSRYLLEMDIVSSSGMDTQLRVTFGRAQKYVLTKAKAAHNKPGRDTRIYMEMVPGTYPHVEFADADDAYSPSYLFVARTPDARQDWADAMDYINIFADGSRIAPGSRVKAWGWK